MADINLLTIEDKKRLEAELKELIEVKQPEIIQQLQEARAQGDLSENADYDAAKAEQGNIEKRINEINNILNNYQLVGQGSSGVKHDVVSISATVKFENLSNKKVYQFLIIGSEGANPKENKISNDCPLARSIIGKKVGDVVEVKGIETPYKVKILEII